MKPNEQGANKALIFLFFFYTVIDNFLIGKINFPPKLINDRTIRMLAMTLTLEKKLSPNNAYLNHKNTIKINVNEELQFNF